LCAHERQRFLSAPVCRRYEIFYSTHLRAPSSRVDTFSHACIHARAHISPIAYATGSSPAWHGRPSSVKIHTALLNAARTFAEQNNARVNLHLLSMHLHTKMISSRVAITDAHVERRGRRTRSRRTHNLPEQGERKREKDSASRGFLCSRRKD